MSITPPSNGALVLALSLSLRTRRPVNSSPLLMFLGTCLPARPQEVSAGSGLKDQQVLGVWGLCQLFQRSVETLRSQLQEKGEGAELVWDKVTLLCRHEPI